MIRIVITGAECTGKTTLATALARRFQLPLVPEAARVFVKREGRAVRPEDVASIAALFGRLVDEAQADGPVAVLYDTDLLSTTVYAEHYFGRCPDAVLRRARSEAADRYILASDDLPWTGEEHQRGTEEGRAIVQEAIRRRLDAWGLPWTEVSGSEEARVQAAARLVDRLLS